MEEDLDQIPEEDDDLIESEIDSLDLD